MRQVFADFRDDGNLWVAILTRAGERAFCAGADIKEFRPGNVETSRPQVASVQGDQVWNPIIAAIHGYCLGDGNELALECVIRIAVENAQSGQHPGPIER